MRKTLSIALPVAIAACGLIAQLLGRTNPWFWFWNGLALALIAGQATLSLTAVRTARKATEDFKILVFDHVAPLARSLSLLSRTDAVDRATQLTATLLAGLTSAAGLATTDRVRATLFRRTKTAEGHDAFEPWRSVGRGDPPQSIFIRGIGSAEGDAVWEYAEADKPRYRKDVKRRPPPGWDATKRRNYRTFITVPVRAGDELVGLLTVNAPKPGELTKDDVGTLQAIAALVGSALGMGDLRWPVSGA